MMNFKNIFTLAVAAFIGLSLTGCSEDNLDTNPYSKSGVNIVGFGPSPVLRTNEIRITGTNLNKVSAVAFPGNAVVERASFNSSDAENIYVNVPDESVPGQIRLLVGNDTVATSASLLTFEEPIEVASVSPTSGLIAGDEITIKGDYVYNIAEVVFTSGSTGAPVAAEDFTYVSRREIRLEVPLAAESGVITLNDGAEWELEYDTPLTIGTAAYTSLSSTSSDFGQQIQIFGSNLHTVENLMFPGGVSMDFTVSDDHSTITTQVPAETKSGAITLVLYSGASLTTDDVQLPTVSITSCSKEKDLKAGDVITITGENFDRITKVTLPGIGEFTDYTISGNTLTFTVPEDMSDGNMEITQNSFISVTQKFMMYSDSGETTIWAGEFVCSGWNGNQDMAWGGFDWSTVPAGSKINFYYTKNNAGSWGCISLRHGDSWANLPDPIPGQYDLDEDEGILSVTFTQEVLDDLIANGGLVVTGDNFTLTKVTMPSSETVLWKGEIGPTNWNGDVMITVDDDIKAQLVAGKTMGIEFYCPEEAGFWQIEICGSWWTGLPGVCLAYSGDTGTRSIMDFQQTDTKFEWKLLQEDIDILTAQGAILFVGNGAMITKWYIK